MYSAGPLTLRAGLESVKVVGSTTGSETGLGLSAGYQLDKETNINVNFAKKEDDKTFGVNAIIGAAGIGLVSGKGATAAQKVTTVYAAYTLPLIVGTVAALRMKDLARGLRWNAVGLIVSTVYLAWGVGAQWQVERIARASLQQAGIEAEGLLVTPAPFNTVLWRLVATTPTQYFEGHRSLLDDGPQIVWRAYDRGAPVIAAHGDVEGLRRMAAFTHGFYSASLTDGRLFVTDLRMGQEPTYTFRFDLGTAAERANGPVAAQGAGSRPDVGRALAWLWRRLQGEPVPPPGVAGRLSGPAA